MKWLDRLLKSITEANQQQFGNTPPSCCQGGQKKDPKTPPKDDR